MDNKKLNIILIIIAIYLIILGFILLMSFKQSRQMDRIEISLTNLELIE